MLCQMMGARYLDKKIFVNLKTALHHPAKESTLLKTNEKFYFSEEEFKEKNSLDLVCVEIQALETIQLFLSTADTFYYFSTPRIIQQHCRVF